MLAAPFIALVMAMYLNLSSKPDSAVQRPEELYRESSLMMSGSACLCVMVVLFFADIPQLQTIFSPTLPRGR
jgi:decaprenyl-phosphate phosphoribosyltransferase